MISIGEIIWKQIGASPRPFHGFPEEFVKKLASEAWPPVQWDMRDSIGLNKLGFLGPYHQLETSLGTYEDRRSCMSLEEYIECKNFFRLLRESRGYDIQNLPACIEEWISHILSPVPIDLVRGPCRPLFDEEMARVLERINAEAMWHYETYEFREYVNVVRSAYSGVTLFTFTVNKVGDANLLTAQAMVHRRRNYSLTVEEWRFKP